MKFNEVALYDLIENKFKLTKVGERMVRKDCYMGYPSLVEEIIKGVGGEILDDFDTNGWQYDYWIPFMLNGKRYTVEGTGYYGTINQIIEDDIEELAEEERRRQESYSRISESATNLLAEIERLNSEGDIL